MSKVHVAEIDKQDSYDSDDKKIDTFEIDKDHELNENQILI
jgi:hypothetical protein